MLEILFSQLNAREIATLIWFIVFLIWIISKKDIRLSLKNLLKTFFQWKIITPLVASVVYFLGITIFLYKVEIWNINYLKDTIVIGLSFSFILIYKLVSNYRKPSFFQKLITDFFTLSVIIEFISNIYTFNLLVELILLPIIVFIILLIEVASREKKYHLVKTLFTYFIYIIFSIYIIFDVYSIITDSQKLLNYDNLLIFSLPFVYTVFYIPFLYLFALIIEYESLFTRVSNCFNRDKTLYNYFKISTIKLCNLNLTKLLKFSNSNLWFLNDTNTKEDVVFIINTFKGGKTND